MNEIIEAAKNGILDPIAELGQYFIYALPGIIVAVLILIVGYFISLFLGFMVRKVLYRFNLDKRLRKADLSDSIGNISLAKLFSVITRWGVFVLFLNQAASYLQLGVISDFIRRIVEWLPKFIAGLMIIILGLIFVDFIVHTILELKNKYLRLFVDLIKVTLIMIVVFTGLEQLGIELTIAKYVFLMILGAVLIAFALAVGIGMGLGLKSEARSLLKVLKKRIK
ncbi:hypothetical protein ACFLYT_00855 [Nanoarchaeota archaeon]